MKTDDPRFDIEFEERDSYLYAFISGKKDSLEISQGFWQCVIDECNKKGFKKLLVEEEFPNQLSTIEIYHLIAKIREMVSAPLESHL